MNPPESVFMERVKLGLIRSLAAVLFKGARVIRSRAVTARGKRLKRNEPCPCGSGKLFKVCHGKGI